MVTFHNQRDYIFVRHHRYVFETADKPKGDDKKGSKASETMKARLQELGPRCIAVDLGAQKPSALVKGIRCGLSLSREHAASSVALTVPSRPPNALNLLNLLFFSRLVFTGFENAIRYHFLTTHNHSNNEYYNCFYASRVPPRLG